MSTQDWRAIQEWPAGRNGGLRVGGKRAALSKPDLARTARVASLMSPQMMVLSKSKTTGSCLPAPSWMSVSKLARVVAFHPAALRLHLGGFAGRRTCRRAPALDNMA